MGTIWYRRGLGRRTSRRSPAYGNVVGRSSRPHPSSICRRRPEPRLEMRGRAGIPHRRGFSADAHPHAARTRERSGLARRYDSNMSSQAELRIPTDYKAGYERARAVAPERADNYMAHTLIGDPEGDALMEELASIDQNVTARWVSRAMSDPNDSRLSEAPSSFVDFVKGMEPPPEWVDASDFRPGIRAFHRNAKLILAAFVLSSIEGFTTNISRSFNMTGRVRDQGVRRLGNNNRFITEIFLPGGLDRTGDGWKLSVRLRFVHAQVRRLLNESDEWDTEAWGVPLHQAHMGYALTTFSVRMLEYLKKLGAVFNEEERRSYTAAWRYAGHLMGTPETILFRNEHEAKELFDIAMLCEPFGTEDSIILSNGAINAAPLVAGISNPSERRELAKYIYSVARALLGDEVSDGMRFPPSSTFMVLPLFRARERYYRLRSRLVPKYNRVHAFSSFTTLLENSTFDDAGISYRWPDHVYAEESSQW